MNMLKMYHRFVAFADSQLLMQAHFIGFIGGCADDTRGHSFGLAPKINDVAAEPIEHKNAKHHDGWVDVDDRDDEHDQDNENKGHAAFDVDVLKTVERNVGHHR